MCMTPKDFGWYKQLVKEEIAWAKNTFRLMLIYEKQARENGHTLSDCHVEKMVGELKEGNLHIIRWVESYCLNCGMKVVAQHGKYKKDNNWLHPDFRLWKNGFQFMLPGRDATLGECGKQVANIEGLI